MNECFVSVIFKNRRMHVFCTIMLIFFRLCFPWACNIYILWFVQPDKQMSLFEMDMIYFWLFLQSVAISKSYLIMLFKTGFSFLLFSRRFRRNKLICSKHSSKPWHETSTFFSVLVILAKLLYIFFPLCFV